MHRENKSPLFKANNLVVTGLMLMEDDSIHRALECFDEALKYTAELWNFKGLALQRLERYDEALHCHETATSMDPDNREFLLEVGQVLHALGRHGECVAVCDDILEKDEDFAHAWFVKAGALCMMEKDDETYECLRKSNDIDPDSTSINIESEAAFDRLRQTPRFERFVGEMRGLAADRSCPRQELSYIR